MKRDQLSRIAHAHHPLASPLDDASVDRLLGLAVTGSEDHVLDLGCGGGEWLLRALTARPGLRAVGVDISEAALRDARAAAIRLGVQERLVLHQRSAADFTSAQPFDAVLSSGATHVFGGLLPTLSVIRSHLAPGGRVIVGEGFWLHTPSPEAVDMLGDLADLATTLDRVVDDGWTPIGGHISTRQELDDYEWAWTGSLASWALDHPGHPDHAQALEVATTHRSEWLRSYRDSWGFVCLVLRRTGTGPG